MHYVLQAPLTLFLFYHELYSDRERFSYHELNDTHTPLDLFLLYYELFSNRELFYDHELREARTLVPLQLSPICSPISPILWLDIYQLDERILKIYISWGIEADTNFHQLSPITINLFTNFTNVMV